LFVKNFPRGCTEFPEFSIFIEIPECSKFSTFSRSVVTLSKLFSDGDHTILCICGLPVTLAPSINVTAYLLKITATIRMRRPILGRALATITSHSELRQMISRGPTVQPAGTITRSTKHTGSNTNRQPVTHTQCRHPSGGLVCLSGCDSAGQTYGIRNTFP